MITSLEDFEKAKSRDLITLQCVVCNSYFKREKHYVQDFINKKSKKKGNFCSKTCHIKNRNIENEKLGLRIKTNCSFCNKSLIITKSSKYSKRNKSDRKFCNCSCAAKYNNTHKTKGNRRSKLEKWLQKEIKKLYPNLKILFNNKKAINSELDIYIPSLKLAFELNGIFHYEPIFGQEKLNNIKNNDNRKFQACLEKGIELCIIDSSKQKYFKESTSIPFLKIIESIINNKLVRHPEFKSGHNEVETQDSIQLS